MRIDMSDSLIMFLLDLIGLMIGLMMMWIFALVGVNAVMVVMFLTEIHRFYY